MTVESDSSRQQVALITGGAGGIGRAIAEGFLIAGYHVVIVGRNHRHLDLALDELRTLGTCTAAPCDVAVQTDVMALMHEVVERHGQIDVLVNSHGTTGSPAPILDLPQEEWTRVLAINFYGALFTSLSAGRYMVMQGQGVIINISSTNAIEASREYAPYCVSKSALDGLTRAMAADLAPLGVRVNGIAPGRVITEMTRTDFERHSHLASSVNMLGRFANPEEIAGLAVFLAGPEAGYIVGQTIMVDGGEVGLHRVLRNGCDGADRTAATRLPSDFFGVE